MCEPCGCPRPGKELGVLKTILLSLTLAALASFTAACSFTGAALSTDDQLVSAGAVAGSPGCPCCIGAPCCGNCGGVNARLNADNSVGAAPAGQ